MFDLEVHFFRPPFKCCRQTLLFGCQFETIGFRFFVRKRLSLPFYYYHTTYSAHIMSSGDYEPVDECDDNFDPDPDSSDFNLNPWWVKSNPL